MDGRGYPSPSYYYGSRADRFLIDQCLNTVCGEPTSTLAIVASANHVARSRHHALCLRLKPPPMPTAYEMRDPAVAEVWRAYARLHAFENEDDRLANTLEMDRTSGLCRLTRWGPCLAYYDGTASDVAAVVGWASRSAGVAGTWEVRDGERHLTLTPPDCGMSRYAVVIRFHASVPLTGRAAVPLKLLQALPVSVVRHRAHMLRYEADLFRAVATWALSKRAFDAYRDAEARALREVGYLEEERADCLP
jgi:hypothetical protein